MKTTLLIAAVGTAALFMVGCETPLPPGTERGPEGTIAYLVPVDATPPGARIEINGTSVGNTPLHLKIFGDRDGTFHDFGSYFYVIRAYPLATNQFPQTQVYWTGRNGTHEDKVPEVVYFDMNTNTPLYGPIEGVAVGTPGYYWPPWYSYPYPYYGPWFYGPGVRVYVGPRFYGYHRFR